MICRHIICVVKDGEYKVAQYGLVGGEPGQAGIGILKFLRTTNIAEFSHRLDSAWFADTADKFGDNVHVEQPQLSPLAGYDVLNIIAKSSGKVPLLKSLHFASDSLFCEWAYVIDLDSNSLECYVGFNTKPLPKGERFAELEPAKKNGYYPVKLLKTYSLNALPSDFSYESELLELAANYDTN